MLAQARSQCREKLAPPLRSPAANAGLALLHSPAARESTMDLDIASLQQDLILLGRVAAAMVLGGMVGIEREVSRHAAGLRTHMLIAGAAALIVGLGDVIAQHFAGEPYRELLRVDPVRLIEATVSAVGFLAAGNILRSRGGDHVRGLTTSASLVMSAAIGICAGLGEYVLALGVSLLCLLVLTVLQRLSGRVGGQAG
jgi:putative Mg2+ transporter-C (MgtC) family protein